MDLPSSAAVSLTDLIRAAVVEKHPWERIQHQSVGAIQDSEIASSIVPFAEQIQSKMKDLDRNLTSLLEEFDDVFPNYSTAVSVDWDANVDEKDELWYHPSLHGSSYPIESFNYSLFDDSSWLHEIEQEAVIVESWQAEADKLTHIAVEAFTRLKENTTNVVDDTMLKTIEGLAKNASDIYVNLQMAHNDKVNARKLHDTPLNRIETWESAGFVVESEINSDTALAKIQSLPLKKYKLKDDIDLTVNKNQRKTRYHVGPVGSDDTSTKLDSSTIFSYNVGALAHIAKSMEELLSKYLATSSFIKHSAIARSVSNLKAITGNSDHFKTPAQLASEVAALETEVALKRITQLCHALVHSTTINLLRARLNSRLKSLVANDWSSEKLTKIERAHVSSREMKAEDSNAALDTVLIYFDAIKNVEILWNSTMRELKELDDAARIESRVAKEEIDAEAAVERENVSLSLDQIRILGNALTAEMIQAIENIFWHLARCATHIISTAEGQRQFLFYVCAIAALVFATSTFKEGISLTCIFILRLFTAPRLVREYGNLRMRPYLITKQTTVDIVIPDILNDRLDKIVEVATAVSSCRRSVLIHGKAGCGKTMIAKKLAQSIGLPYAIMSGGDVFPLKSQGPSELRRLLLWASKGAGGIIIIDEAEVLLGSRSKTKPDTSAGGLDGVTKSSSAGYSRDCLNVLLSMTGTFGNIMLILTTSNPGELDEAVLDRMDEHIDLSLPSKNERFSILNNAFSQVFCSADAIQRKTLTSCLSRSLPNATYNSSFNVESALSDLSSKTNGFSGRELTKLVQSVLYKCYASESGILDSSLWTRETRTLCESFASKHMLKS